GAPHRLITLMEGEGLFSDVTLIVMAHTLLAIVFSGTVSDGATLTSILAFFKVMLGGIAIGWLFAKILGTMLGLLRNNKNIELSILTVLPYLSFLTAEYMFHVSGVMATAVAGIVMSGWGNTKITPSVKPHFMSVMNYLGYIASVVIFIYVGLQVDLAILSNVSDLLLIVIMTMIAARFVSVFGLLSIVNMFSKFGKIDWKYRTLIFWGSARGAVAIAITLSLGDFKHADDFLAIVTGAVLLSFLIPGLTLGRLVSFLKLDRPPVEESVAKIEGIISAKKKIISQIPEMQTGGILSEKIATDLRSCCMNVIDKSQDELNCLRQEGLGERGEEDLLFFRCLNEERTLYYKMFSNGHITENTYRQLVYSVVTQLDLLKNQGYIPTSTINKIMDKNTWTDRFICIMRKIPGLSVFFEWLRIRRIIQEYEVAWARHKACIQILDRISTTGEMISGTSSYVKTLQDKYLHWDHSALSRLDAIAEQFPEFVRAMQAKHATRMALHTEKSVIEERQAAGNLPENVAEELLEDLSDEMHRLNKMETQTLRIDILETLSRVPFFEVLSREDLTTLAQHLTQSTYPSGKVIIQQGEHSRSLLIIGRGVVRVSRSDNGREKNLATMLAGDFFGERALLLDEPRTATCRAVTPCSILELSLKKLEDIQESYPSVREKLEQVNRERILEQQEKMSAHNTENDNTVVTFN
ncbi:MAG: cation:proton antiporter, partial [Gammaproteobacteria bacterium]|nr:cation:proton antiporter [Gammaproteobacteria bacterium]